MNEQGMHDNGMSVIYSGHLSSSMAVRQPANPVKGYTGVIWGTGDAGNVPSAQQRCGQAKIIDQRQAPSAA